MSNRTELPVIIVGAGGHAKVLIDALKRLGTTISGVVDRDAPKLGENSFCGVPVLGDDQYVLSLDPQSVYLINGIGTVRSTHARRAVYDRFKAKGFTFKTLVDSTAWVASDVRLGEGVQVLARAVIQPGTRIGADTIVNTAAVVDHDCRVEAHCHIAPRATLSGKVTLGEQSHLGTGACVIQGVHIGRDCTIGAGAAVTQDLPDGVTAVGVPARFKEP